MDGALSHTQNGKASFVALLLIENFRRLRQKYSVIHGLFQVLPFIIQ